MFAFLTEKTNVQLSLLMIFIKLFIGEIYKTAKIKRNISLFDKKQTIIIYFNLHLQVDDRSKMRFVKSIAPPDKLKVTYFVF